MIPELSEFRLGWVHLPGRYFNEHRAHLCPKGLPAPDDRPVFLYTMICLKPEGIWARTKGVYAGPDKVAKDYKGTFLIIWSAIAGIHLLDDAIKFRDNGGENPPPPTDPEEQSEGSRVGFNVRKGM